MSHDRRYKQRGLNFKSAEDSRALRAVENKVGRRAQRDALLSRMRMEALDVSSSKPAQNDTKRRGKHPLADVSSTNTEKKERELELKRYQELLKWREDRRKKLDVEKRRRKPSFKTGVFQPDPARFLVSDDVKVPESKVTTPAKTPFKYLQRSSTKYGFTPGASTKKVPRFCTGVTPTTSGARVPKFNLRTTPNQSIGRAAILQQTEQKENFNLDTTQGEKNDKKNKRKVQETDMKRVLRGRSTRRRQIMEVAEDLGVQALPVTPAATRSRSRRRSQVEPAIEQVEKVEEPEPEPEISSSKPEPKPEILSFAPDNFTFEFKAAIKEDLVPSYKTTTPRRKKSEVHDRVESDDMPEVQEPLVGDSVDVSKVNEEMQDGEVSEPENTDNLSSNQDESLYHSIHIDNKSSCESEGEEKEEEKEEVKNAEIESNIGVDDTDQDRIASEIGPEETNGDEVCAGMEEGGTSHEDREEALSVEEMEVDSEVQEERDKLGDGVELEQEREDKAEENEDCELAQEEEKAEENEDNDLEQEREEKAEEIEDSDLEQEREEKAEEIEDCDSHIATEAKDADQAMEQTKSTSDINVNASLVLETPMSRRRSTRRSARLSACLDFSLTPVMSKLRPRTPCSRSTRRSLTAHTDFVSDKLMTPRNQNSVRRSTRRSSAKKLRKSDVRDLTVNLDFEEHQMEDSASAQVEMQAAAGAVPRIDFGEENVIQEEVEEEMPEVTTANDEAVTQDSQDKKTPIKDNYVTPSNSRSKGKVSWLVKESPYINKEQRSAKARRSCVPSDITSLFDDIPTDGSPLPAHLTPLLNKCHLDQGQSPCLSEAPVSMPSLDVPASPEEQVPEEQTCSDLLALLKPSTPSNRTDTPDIDVWGEESPDIPKEDPETPLPPTNTSIVNQSKSTSPGILEMNEDTHEGSDLLAPLPPTDTSVIKPSKFSPAVTRRRSTRVSLLPEISHTPVASEKPSVLSEDLISWETPMTSVRKKSRIPVATPMSSAKKSAKTPLAKARPSMTPCRRSRRLSRAYPVE